MMAFNHGQIFLSSFILRNREAKTSRRYCILSVRLTKTKNLRHTTLWDNEHGHSLLVGV